MVVGEPARDVKAKVEFESREVENAVRVGVGVGRRREGRGMRWEGRRDPSPAGRAMSI